MVVWVAAAVAATGAGTAPAAAGDDAARWQQTLDRVTKAVVSIRMDRPRSFEGVGRGNSQATGFVVDAEQGLILTNRHVVTAGPVVAQAVFLDNEEVDLVPVYRDPIHDFGIFRYDPAKLRFLHPQALPLVPSDAKVGAEIRVVGNDSGERLSILDGTIARVDRPAPVYGGGYSDYDTFYIQAASSTSGGSSGSPVVDVDGDVVALNAGAKGSAATSFYLPLDRVVRAVDLVRAGKAVPRGTLETRMEHTPFDELRRLGLTDAAEAEARRLRPEGTGMLVVREVLPEGPAAGALEVGDIVLAAGGEPVLDFVALEGLLDDSVGRKVPVVVERAGERVEVELEVGDLHALVPSRLLEIGGGVVTDLSIHQARGAQIATRGAYVADDGQMFARGGVGTGAVLREVDGEPVDDLDDLLAALRDVPDGGTFVVRWFPASRPSQGIESSVRMDRRWFPVRLCERDDAAGGWDCAEQAAPAGEPEERAAPTVALPPTDDKRARPVVASLVGVRTEVPYPVAGLGGTSYTGAGLIVDAERGLVVVDRDTVPVALADVRLVIAGAVEIPARVVALHEVHDLAVVQYDPADVEGIPLASAELRPGLEAGDKATWVGLEPDAQITSRKVEVTGIEPFSLGSDGAPRFRETNLDVLDLRDRPPGTNGVFVDKKGRVAAFWASMSYNDGREARATWQAIPAEVVADAVALADGADELRALGWELSVLPLPAALDRGLPASEVEKLVAFDPERRSVLQVVRTERGDPIGEKLRPGDLLIEIDGRPVVRFRDVERAIRGRDAVTLTIFRAGRIESVDVSARPLDPIDVDRVILWAGVRVHAPDRSARLLAVPPARPYVTWLEAGSPAGRARLYATRSITSVNGVDTPDLDAFVKAILSRPADAPVRLELVTRDGQVDVITVEPDEDFFPTEELVWQDGAWVRRRLR